MSRLEVCDLELESPLGLFVRTNTFFLFAFPY